MKFLRSGMNFLTPLLLLLHGELLFGNTIDYARKLENEGLPEEAVQIYGNWLIENQYHPDAGNVLIHASSLHEDPFETISYLGRYVHLIEPTRQGEIYSRMAELEVILGLLQHALTHYSLAIKSGGSQVEFWKLEDLILRYSMGLNVYDEAVELLMSSSNSTIKSKSGLLTAMLAGREDPGKGIAAINKLIDDGLVLPSTWLELARLQIRSGDREGAEKSARSLERDFPGSVHLYVLQSRIQAWESPSMLMESQADPVLSFIQVGAFRQRKLAAQLRNRLEFDGFTSWLENENDLWLVIVNNPDNQAEIRLKSKGYDVSVYR